MHIRVINYYYRFNNFESRKLWAGLARRLIIGLYGSTILARATQIEARAYDTRLIENNQRLMNMGKWPSKAIDRTKNRGFNFFTRLPQRLTY